MLVVIISLAAFAQDTPHIATPDSSNVTWSKVYNDVKGALVGLGSALKTSADHVYAVLIKQQLLNAIMWSVVGAIILVFLLVFRYNFKKADFDEFDRHGTLAMISGIISAILILFFMCHLDTVIDGFFNPEYGALKDVMSFIK